MGGGLPEARARGPGLPVTTTPGYLPRQYTWTRGGKRLAVADLEHGHYCLATATGPLGWWLRWLHVEPEARGQGLARRILERVCADADREGLAIMLEARACAPDPGAQEKLLSLYRSLGWEEWRPGMGAYTKTLGGIFMLRHPRRRVRPGNAS